MAISSFIGRVSSFLEGSHHRDQVLAISGCVMLCQGSFHQYEFIGHPVFAKVW